MSESVIWKFPLKHLNSTLPPWEFRVKTPLETEPLHFGYDSEGQLCMWGQFQTVNEKIEQTMVFFVILTDQPFNIPTAVHEATVVKAESAFVLFPSLVFHIFRGAIYENV